MEEETDLQSRTRSKIQEILPQHKLLEENIIAIYGIGSVAKRSQNIHDIDLNIFLKKVEYPVLLDLRDFIETLSKELLLPIDINVIDIAFFDRNIAGSDIFLHKNRHSLFLYELKVVKNLLYGLDILDTIEIHYPDLIQECVKLTATLTHRFNKELLVHGEQAILLQAKKYARYAAEFSLIFKGVVNPYVHMNGETYLRHFPEMNTFKCIHDLWNGDPANSLMLSDYYNFIVALSHLLLNRYIALVKNEYPESRVCFGDGNAYPSAWFVFKDIKELKEFSIAYDTLSDHRKIH